MYVWREDPVECWHREGRGRNSVVCVEKDWCSVVCIWGQETGTLGKGSVALCVFGEWKGNEITVWGGEKNEERS